MKATIINANVIKLKNLAIGEFAEGIDRSKKNAIFVKTALRSVSGAVLSEHVVNLLDPKDQYPDKTDQEQMVRTLLPGDELRIKLE